MAKWVRLVCLGLPSPKPGCPGEDDQSPRVVTKANDFFGHGVSMLAVHPIVGEENAVCGLYLLVDVVRDRQ